jgi:hypothetical protein
MSIKEIVTVDKGLHLGSHVVVIYGTAENYSFCAAKFIQNPGSIVILFTNGKRSAIFVTLAGVDFIFSQDNLFRFDIVGGCFL